jgi:hypothetical protein
MSAIHEFDIPIAAYNGIAHCQLYQSSWNELYLHISIDPE